MTLEQIGFYTLSEARARTSSATTPLMRAELLLGARCNFHCPYCRSIGGKDLSYEQAEAMVDVFIAEGLKNLRLSGGEPTLWPHLIRLVRHAKEGGIERIAISTNGSAPQDLYRELIASGVNDFSISLDACCAEDGDKMAGGVKGAWDTVVQNIRDLSPLTYVTVGVVLTEANASRINDTIQFAHDLGVSDIRVIPAAQCGTQLQDVHVSADLLDAHPILAYRIAKMQAGESVRGITATDTHKCRLVVDDVAVMEGQHYPCIIYMRERGAAIGPVGPTLRQDRVRWMQAHDTHADPICAANCLDVCIQFNNRKEWYANQN